MRANETFTKTQLFAILASKDARIMLNGFPYILSSIERESGGGRDFNLYVYGANNAKHSFYVRTAD
jgi:hypothetical protein